jgi:chromate reductase
MQLLALSGSLRANSINTALLRAAAKLAAPGTTVTVSELPGALPLFNPDQEASPPPVVTAFRQEVAAADALIIASPEYAHGITGTMKNALDWLVSFEPFSGKRIAVLNASPRAHHADDALREILQTMDADIVQAASISVPLVGAGLDETAMLATPEIAAAILRALDAIQGQHGA